MGTPTTSLTNTEIEIAQVYNAMTEQRIEPHDLVDKGRCFNRCCCPMISGLGRHMSIHNVSRHLGLRWEQ
jgi:hypothetical protein